MDRYSSACKMGDIDIVLADTSGRLHTNCDLMVGLYKLGHFSLPIACKRLIS